MVKPAKIRRFRTNPVEFLVFAGVSVLFVKSVYSLFYEQQVVTTASMPAITFNPTTEGRAPASTSQAFVNLEVKCEGSGDQDTTAVKVRLIGPLCGATSSADAGKLLKAMITNTANKFSATVFTDIGAAKFSTDYIQLNSGKNPIHLEFSYRDGKVSTHDLTITKN